MYQYAALHFNLSLNCPDNYIGPKLKQRRWRPQRFVCLLSNHAVDPQSFLPLTAMRSIDGFATSMFFKLFCSQVTFSMQVDPGLISICVE